MSMIPIFTKIFDTLQIQSSRKNSPNKKIVAKTSGANSPIHNDMSVKNVYNQVFSTEQTQASKPRVTAPSPETIMKDISTGPLLNVQTTRENYKEVEVCWEIKIHRMEAKDDLLEISGFSGGGGVPVITFDVLSSQNPRLKTVAQNAKVFVKGRISEVSDIAIHLKDTVVIFVD